MTTVMGIDPGLTGGVAVIGPDCMAAKMPMIGKDVDGAQIANWVRLFEPKLVIIEQQGTRPGESIRASQTTGKNLGILMGVMYACGASFQIVAAQKWKQQTCGYAKDKKKQKLKAAEHVARKYPWAEIRGPQGGLWDGVCDALCIAEYGRKDMGNE